MSAHEGLGELRMTRANHSAHRTPISCTPSNLLSPGMCSFLDIQRATTRCAVRFYSGHVATYEYCDRHAAQVEATDKGSNIAERSFEIPPPKALRHRGSLHDQRRCESWVLTSK